MRNRFDRQSGSDKSGIRTVVKRNGNNWGSPIGDLEEHSQKVSQQSSETDGPSDQTGGNPSNDMEQDDTKYITVDQWQSKRVERTKPIYNIRKAGEGEMQKPDWKKMIVLQQKKKNSSTKSSDGINDYEYDAPQRVGRLQRVVDIEFKFKDDRRGTGFLGAMSTGRNPSKSEAEQASDLINMNDEQEFPTLG